MQWRIACLRRNPLRIQRSDEVLGRNPGELFRIHMEDVGVLSVARASRIALLRRDARDFRKQLIKESAVAVAMKSLLFQPPQLYVQNCPLPLAEPVIRPVDEMAVEPLAGHAPAVVNRARLALEMLVIGDDDSALARCHQLACLKAEGSRRAECPNLF